jgi:pimeloyl-ACP methyl ester carboxylesterase
VSASDRAPKAVLVHGAFHGSWCWDRVVALLAARDVTAVAVDLPGHGADPGPFGNLHDDATRVREVLDGIEGPVVLVGHSYGGAVITEAGTHPAVGHLVYLCALNPDETESCVNAAVGEITGSDVTLDQGDLAAGMNIHQDLATVDQEIARRCFYNDCDEATQKWALARLGSQPMVTFSQSPAEVAWRTTPSTYVICSEDRAVPPGLQRRLATRCGDTLEWDTSHSPFLSRPQLVVDLIAELVG